MLFCRALTVYTAYQATKGIKISVDGVKFYLTMYGSGSDTLGWTFHNIVLSF